TYQSGDYWTIPARAASGLIDWPPCGSDGNLFQPPRSITVYNAPLACIHWDKRKRQMIVDPCRRIFYPLTELTPPATPPALHITNYSWQNDDIMTFDQLLKTGLTLTLDQAPTGPVSGASFIVTVEAFNISFASSFNRTLAAAPADAAPAAATTSPAANLLLSTQAFSFYAPLLQTLPRTPFILDWQTSVNTKAMQITWGLPETILTGVQFRYLEVINNNILGLFAEYGLLARARVQLLGREIFSQSGATQAFLDGQCFGSPATRQDGKTPCLALQMPSGNGEKASDFEGWFYLAPFNSVSQLSINFAAFTVVVDALGAVTGVVSGTPPQAVTPQITVMLAYPAATVGGVTVSFVLSATTAGINTNSYVSLQAPTLTIPQGSSQGTLNLNVFGNPGAGNTYGFQITASVELAYGTATTQSVTFTLTGVQSPIGFVGRSPINFNQ
ncbi:MAG TPA: hypothetical protein VGR96_17180, partial [Acidobacteriaceae bacterium]|nr:hypothetical protein [Acidobacteriaceae bacterium]